MTDVTKELKLSKQLYEQLVFQRNKIKDLEIEKTKSEERVTYIEGSRKKLLILVVVNLNFSKIQEVKGTS